MTETSNEIARRPGRPATPLHVRFWGRVEKTNKCWLFTGALSGNGYGVISEGGRWGRSLLAHRYAYQSCVGPIPEGKVLDHLCRNRSCVNPDHLEPVTQRTNTIRGEAVTARNAEVTLCPQGHPYDESNTYWRPAGGRGCRPCRADAAAKYEASGRRTRKAS